ncbi:MAG: hypothetical protein ACXVBE_00710 [Bdellovibrionota bacterium]
MKISTLAVFAVFATLTVASVAQASCNIYTSDKKYVGNMITTGSSYVGVYPGASDSTPYAGSIRDGVVSIREKDPQKVATVEGSRMIDLLGKLVATVDGAIVSDAKGNVLAITENPYDQSGLCAPEVALAGATLFVIYGR